MEKICILDTETTGIDPNKGKLLEIGVILFDLPTRSILSQASTLMYATENPVYDINKIKVDALKKIDHSLQSKALSFIREIIYSSDAIVAHNANFDKKWINTVPEIEEVARHKPWICTKNDVTWPIRKNSPLNLIHICVDLGVPVVNAHRAIGDCFLLVNALGCISDLSAFLSKKTQDKKLYYGDIRADQIKLAKDLGFTWNNDKKIWNAYLSEEEVKTIPFKIDPTCP